MTEIEGGFDMVNRSRLEEYKKKKKTYGINVPEEELEAFFKAERKRLGLPDIEDPNSTSFFDKQRDVINSMSDEEYRSSFNKKTYGINATEEQLNRFFAERKKALSDLKTSTSAKNSTSSKNNIDVDAARFAARYSSDIPVDPTELNKKKKEKSKKKDNTFSDYAKAFVRGTGKVIDALVPFGNPIEDGLVKDINNASFIDQDVKDWLNDAFKPADTKKQKVLDSINEIGASLVPFGGAYKLADKAIDAVSGISKLEKATKLPKTNALKEAQKGFVAGTLYGTQEEIGEAINNRQNSVLDAAKNVALYGVGGAVADPLIYGAGKAIGKGLSALDDLRLAQQMKKIPDIEGIIRLQDGKVVPKDETLNKLLPDELYNRKTQGDVLDKISNMLKTYGNSNPMTKLTSNNLVNSIPDKAPDLSEFLNKIRPNNDVKVPNLNEFLAQIRPNSNRISTSSQNPLQALKEILPNNSLPNDIQAMRGQPIPFRQPKGDKQFKEMGVVEQAINYIKRKLGSPNTYYQPITRRQILDNMRKRLGITIRNGRLGNVPEDVQGVYKTNPEVIRSREYGDIQVISHEIGHHLDKKYQLANPQFDQELLKLGMPTSAPNYTQEQVRQEGLAEFIRLFLTDPERALQEAPLFSQHFDQVLPKKVKTALLKTQQDIDLWIEQGEVFRFRGRIDRVGKKEASVTEKIDKLYSQLVDRFDTFKKVEKAITGKINDASQSLYKKARLSVGAPKKAEVILRDLKKILAPIDEYGFTMKDVGDFATAIHARELEALGKKTGLPKKEIDAVIQKFDSPEMRAIQQELVTYNNALLDILVDAQILSVEAVEKMRQMYPNYVPFFRFFEEDMTSGFGHNGFANLTNPVKRMQSSTNDIIDPLEGMIKNTFAVVSAAEKNKVGLELAKLAEIEGAGRFIEKLDGKQPVGKENIVTIFVNGEKVQYQLDKELYRAVQQLDEESSNILIKLLSAPANTLRAGATLSPEFMLRNPIRDQFQAFVVSNYGYNPIIDLPAAMLRVIGTKLGFHSKMYELWAKSGGGYGNYLSQDRNYIKEQLRQLKREGHPLMKGIKTVTNPKEWLRFLQALSEISEESTKLGEFTRAIKKGATPEEAAFQSRDLMDFGRSGSSIKQLNRVIAFLNANIQGKDRLARAFKNNPVRTTIRALTAVTLPTIGAYLAMENFANEKQKEAWKNTPQWLKDTFFILPIPGTDELLRIPKPFDLAPVFSNLPEQILDFVKHNDPRSWEEFTKDSLKQYSIPYMLTGLTPIIENITNYSFFTGGPVVPYRDQDLLPADQYGVSTSLTARTLGKALDYSPYKIDNLIRGYGAGLGRYATSGLDQLLERLGAGKMPPQEAKKWSELPVINAFTVNTTGGGKVMNEFYDTLDKMNREAKSAMKNEQPYEKEGQLKILRSASRQISEIREQYRKVQESYEMSPEEKRKKLDEYDRKMRELARKALENIQK
jgi:hypothetical protein